MMPADGHLAKLTDEEESRLGRILDAFENAWNEAWEPRLEEFLPEEEAIRHAALVELVYIDQEYAIQAGSGTSVEDYLARFSDLASDTEALIEIVARDLRYRLRRGEQNQPENYLERFPHLGKRLEDRLRIESDGSPADGSLKLLEMNRSADERNDFPSALPDEENPLYQQIRHHAQGGMGDVFRARDVTLERDVALKRVRLSYNNESRVRRRFLREAKLTARLDHPGIVPIHGLIWDRAKQPWYVMRFVEGHTLAQAIDAYHDSGSTDHIVGDRVLTFRMLLARYVALCDTIAFAHSRDVVHRDIKPANVILGDYGETIVLDWGLATLAHAEQDDPLFEVDPKV
jgi:tRNA A-37 threonylcarbamoyl transferase component Bud32